MLSLRTREIAHPPAGGAGGAGGSGPTVAVMHRPSASLSGPPGTNVQRWLGGAVVSHGASFTRPSLPVTVRHWLQRRQHARAVQRELLVGLPFQARPSACLCRCRAAPIENDGVAAACHVEALLRGRVAEEPRLRRADVHSWLGVRGSAHLATRAWPAAAGALRSSRSTREARISTVRRATTRSGVFSASAERKTTAVLLL